MNNHARDNRLTVTGNDTRGLICGKLQIFFFVQVPIFMHETDNRLTVTS